MRPCHKKVANNRGRHQLFTSGLYIRVHMLIHGHTAPPHAHTKKNVATTQNINSPLTTYIISPLEIAHLKQWSICIKMLDLNLCWSHSRDPCVWWPLGVMGNPSVSSFTVSFSAYVLAIITNKRIGIPPSNCRTWKIL